MLKIWVWFEVPWTTMLKKNVSKHSSEPAERDKPLVYGVFKVENCDTLTTQTQVWQSCLNTSKFSSIVMWRCHVTAEGRFVWDFSSTESWHDLQDYCGTLMLLGLFSLLWEGADAGHWCSVVPLTGSSDMLCFNITNR